MSTMPCQSSQALDWRPGTKKSEMEKVLVWVWVSKGIEPWVMLGMGVVAVRLLRLRDRTEVMFMFFREMGSA